MAKRDTHKLWGPVTDPSLEFDLFEVARLRLVEVFVEGGRERIEAERIALYVMQGVRHVPRLLKVLSRIESPTHEEILDALGPVLDEALALEKAKRLLLQQDAQPDNFSAEN